MSRLPLPTLAAIASAMLLSPLAAIAQDSAPIANHTPAVVERTALDLPAFSSSSSPDLLFASAQSSNSSQAAPTVNRPESGAGPFSGIAVGVKFGSAGVGFDVATPLVPQRLNLRGGASFFSYSPSTITTSDNMNINGTLKFRNADVMVDYFPFHGRFRLSGGMTVYNFTNLSASLGIPTGQSITVGGNSYYSDPRKPLTGSGAFNFGGKTAGRVSIGTGNMLPRKGRFTFESELGVQFFSEPTVTYTFAGNGCPAANSPESECAPIPTTNVASEQKKLQNDLTDLKYFPVLSIGLSYRIH